jgi:hypothetical protein
VEVIGAFVVMKKERKKDGGPRWRSHVNFECESDWGFRPSNQKFQNFRPMLVPPM